LATEERRSVERSGGDGRRRAFLHFVANATWSGEQMLTKGRELVVLAMTQRGPIEAMIIDDTSFPDKGRHSVECIMSVTLRGWAALTNRVDAARQFDRAMVASSGVSRSTSFLR
jgi:DDE superfamily endonuclease